jgi:Family of unknown function (DUF6256)
MSSHLIRSDLIPIVTGYVLVMVILAAGLLAARRLQRAGLPLTRHTGRLDRGWPALFWHVLIDALGGYLLLAAVVILYYYLVARVGSNFLDSEFSGGALLLAIAVPIYLVASWLRELREGRRRGRNQRPGPVGPDGTGNGPDRNRPPQS